MQLKNKYFIFFFEKFQFADNFLNSLKSISKQEKDRIIELFKNKFSNNTSEWISEYKQIYFFLYKK